MTELHNIVLVNEQDQPVGTASKTETHQKGLLHRAFSVFIVDSKQNILLQQRHPDKYHCGGLWTNTCCSHPFPNEDIIDAGQRRLTEELGFTVPLKHVGEFCYRAEFDNGLIEHEYDHVLLGQYNDQPLDQFDRSEILALEWDSLNDLEANLIKSPEKYTPWLAPALECINTYL